MSESKTDALEGVQRQPDNAKSYLLPYDDVERQRLPEQQTSLTEIFEGRVVIAPVDLKNGDEVLDIATGSGVWALDVANRHAAININIHIACIDISDRMFPNPYEHDHPQRISFNIGSALAMPAAWTDRYTLVHQRLILSGIKHHEWERDVREVYRVTKPGGWAQLCENNALACQPSPAAGTTVTVGSGPGPRAGPARSRLREVYVRLGKKTGRDFFCGERIPGLMRDAGFVDVVVERRDVPLGAWNGGAAGVSARFARNLGTVFRGFRAVIMQHDGFGLVGDGEEYGGLVDEVEREWAAGPGAVLRWEVIVGRKPACIACIGIGSPQ